MVIESNFASDFDGDDGTSSPAQEAVDASRGKIIKKDNNRMANVLICDIIEFLIPYCKLDGLVKSQTSNF